MIEDSLSSNLFDVQKQIAYYPGLDEEGAVFTGMSFGNNPRREIRGDNILITAGAGGSGTIVINGWRNPEAK